MSILMVSNKDNRNLLIMNRNKNKQEKGKIEINNNNNKESSKRVTGMTIMNKAKRSTNKKVDKCKNNKLKAITKTQVHNYQVLTTKKINKTKSNKMTNKVNL